MAEDDWLTAAMADHTLVAQLLLKIHQQPPPPPPPRSVDVYAPALRLDWSVKQRRSRKIVLRKKDGAARASPTTPLSWSGGTSDSCCAADESKPIDSARSKVVVSDTPITKRSRKKKTLPELREEESLLLKERRNLKNQLATMQLSLEKQRDENERLKKRLKTNLLSRQTPTAAVESGKIDSIEQIEVPCDPASPISKANPYCGDLELPPGDSLCKKEAGGVSAFELPDLNLPLDENPDSGILCGVS